MLPSKLRKQFHRDVVPSDANIVLLTNSSYNNMACAIPIVLAASDPDCSLVCAQETANLVLKTRMLDPVKLIVIGGSQGSVKKPTIDLGFAKLSLVHARHHR